MELKAFEVNGKALFGRTYVREVYLKSEADKVIAEKDAEIARLKAIRKVHVEAIASMGAGSLAMAMWCDTKGDWYYSLGEHFRDCVEFYIKWRDRWLKIAEKFKEAK